MSQPSQFRMLRSLAVAAALVVAAPAFAAPVTLEIDKSHSNVGFTIRHLVSRVHGEFKDVKGTIAFDQADYSKSTVEATIDAASINTNNENRDNDLRGENFFEVEKYPTITFVSKSIAVGKDGKGTMTGDFTMRGVTKPITLDVTVNGVQSMGPTNTVAGFTATGKLNRKDYGIVWNKTFDQGGTLLGDDVDLTIDVEAKTPRPKPAAAATPAPATPAPTTAGGDKK
jgi:polyisoprenoid-binding protein YceI